MIRTQVQLSEGQYERLRRMAEQRGASMAQLIREGVDLVLEGADESPRDRARRKAMKLAGRFSSGLGDLSQRHDAYLAEAFEE